MPVENLFLRENDYGKFTGVANLYAHWDLFTMSNLPLSTTWIFALALSAILLSAVACGSGETALPPPTATFVPRPTATPGVKLMSQEEIVRQLRRNAADCQYTVGSYGGRVTYATVSEPLTFNLVLANDAGSSEYLGYLFEGLPETSWLTDEVEPSLAETWEHSEDGLTWSFHLRQDVQWHDGTPFTAHDVDFTFNQILYNEDIPTTDRGPFIFHFQNAEGEWQEKIMTVRALDDYTVQCVLSVPFATFLRSMGTPIYPKHVLEPVLESGDFESVWDINADPAESSALAPSPSPNTFPRSV